MSLELCSQAVLAYSRQPVKPGKDKAPLRSKYTSVSSIAKPSQNLSSLVGVVSIDVEAASNHPAAGRTLLPVAERRRPWFPFGYARSC
jgi:hypothetical protein